MFLNSFIFWLALLPLVVWKTGYEGPKVIYFFIGNVAIIVYWLSRFLKGKKLFDFSRADYLYLLWLVALTIASFTGIHPMESILGDSYRHQGVIFFLGLWLIAKTILLLNPDQKQFLKRAIAVTVIIEAVIVIIQFFGLSFKAPLGTLGEPNAVAGALAIGSYFLGIQNLIGMGIVLTAVAATLSKIGLFSFAVSNYALLFKRTGKKLFILLSAGVLLVSLFVVFRTLGDKLQYLTTPATSLWHLEQEDRVLIWRMAGNKVAERPILGWGAESSDKVIDAAYKEADMPLMGLTIDRAHNLVLDILMWSGVVGAMLFFGWIYLSFKELGDVSKKFAFISFIVFSMFQPLGIVHWVFLIIVLTS